jgi:uncharacterized protein YwqG
MDKADVEAAFVAAGLSRLLKDINYLAQPSIRLYTTAVDESTLSIGTSKIGGLPDLPSGISWPTYKDLPQSFIAQIRLDDVRQYDVDKVLPEQGMLWFFYDAQQETFGADPADRGGWQVFFSDDTHPSLQHTSAPTKLPADSQFHACSLRITSEITLSQQPKLEIPNFDWTKEEQQKYEQLLSTFPDSADRALPHNRLLGNPDTIQDDMRSQCQLVSHGVTDENDPRAAELSSGAKNWHLLFQVDSDEHAGMRWADNGLLYYWIEQADLAARRFDATWLVLQSE